jgi:hypothetical protein
MRAATRNGRATPQADATVCLFVEIELPGHPRTVAGEVTREARRRDLLELSAQRQRQAHRGSVYFLGPRHHPCACHLVLEADEDRTAYALDPDRLEALEATLRFLAARAGIRGLTLRAAYVTGPWSELPAPPSAHVTLDAIIAILRNGQLRRNVRYVVRDHDS